MSITDKRIQRYKEAYYDFHGRNPVIRKSGSWLYINHVDTAYRSSELTSMTNNLRRMANASQNTKTVKEHKYNTEDIWVVEENYKSNKNVRMAFYEKEIGTDLIVLFLDKLHFNCGSLYDMDKCIRDYALSNILSKGLSNDVVNFEHAIKEMRDTLKRKEEIHSKETKILAEEVLMLRKKIKQLRENSVLFTMEDLEETLPKGKKPHKKTYKARVIR